jgi:hypothetical protein
MPSRVCLAWAVLLASCVDLTPPPELRKPIGAPATDPDAGADDDGPAAPGTGDMPDGGETPVDAPVVPEPDAALEPDAPIIDTTFLPPDLLGPDLPPDAPPLRANGNACTAGSQCVSGLCVDAFCCNLPCNGRCQACDVAGAEGKCMPIKAGDDPDNECDIDPVATCGRDGSCDGQGACRRYAPGVQCKPGSCTGSMETEASTCNASGLCQTGATKMCQGGHTCMNGSCASMCNLDGECQNGFFCDGNKTCQVKRPGGEPCAAMNQCSSGFCVDGVCCNQICDQPCYACNLSGTVGTCNPVPDGMESGPTPECPAQDVSTCGRVGGCNGRGACRMVTTGTPCGPQTCSGSLEADTRHCNGVGACDPAATHDCGAYLCSGNACGTTCTTTAQCKAGFACVGTACRLVKITNLVVHDTTNAALWGIVDQFQIGMAAVHPWGDAMWKDTYVKSIDATANFLIGKQWIKVSAESKKYSAGPQATITLATASDIYLVVDDRWGASPTWLAGYTNTAVHFQVQEVVAGVNKLVYQFTLYKKTAAAGMLDLPKIGASTAYDYFVIAD